MLDNRNRTYLLSPPPPVHALFLGEKATTIYSRTVEVGVLTMRIGLLIS